MTVDLPPRYPHRWEVDVALADGGTVHVRPIRPDDAERLHRFHGRQSAQSIYFRFFSPRPQLSDRDVERFTNIDYDERMAFVALLAGEIIGVARYDAFGSDRRAEVAFFVDDAHHGRGLATLLLEYLAVAAKENGITGFMATVLPENREMIRVFRWAGFDVATTFADGVVEVTLGIEPTAEGVERIAERARLAEARSVARLLRPGSVAVVGASREPWTVGHEVLRSLVDGGFEGPVYPVNRSARHVRSVRAYANVADVPDDVDVVVVAVPAAEVPAVVVDCARKHVEGLVVLSAAEHDDMSDWEELVTLARGHGMRLVGPASVGVVNNDPTVRLRATVAAGWPAAGTVAMSTQSGSVGATVLEMATEWGIGLSCFVNLGLKGDVSGNDLMQFWEDDPGTDVIVLYLESFGNPRKFFRIARRIGRAKPIVALHTSELAAPRPAPTIGRRFWPAAGTHSALLAQAGVIAVTTLAELFHVALLLESQPLPAGDRVAVIANAAQPGLLAAEEARRSGLTVADLGPMGALDLGPARAVDLGSADAVDAGPVGALDLGWRADADRYRAVLGEALARDDVDAAIVVFAPPVLDRAERVAAAVDEVALAAGKPVVATFLGDRLENMPGDGKHDRSEGRRPDGRRAHRVPRFRFPEQGARALGHVARYSRWRSEPEGEPPTFPDLDLDRAAEVVAAALDRSPAGGPLPLADALAVLRAGGIEAVGQVEVTSLSEALAAAVGLGYPVALKAGVRPRFARTEETGLALGLHAGDELAETYQRMRDALGSAMDGALVQAMAPVGLDVQVVAHQDAHLGPLVALGRGGAAGSTPEELVVRLVPLTTLDARRLVAASPVEELLERLESEDAALRLEELVLRVSALVEAVPDLAEIRLDPVLVSAGALAVTDLTVLVAPFVSPLGPAVRRLG